MISSLELSTGRVSEIALHFSLGSNSRERKKKKEQLNRFSISALFNQPKPRAKRRNQSATTSISYISEEKRIAGARVGGTRAEGEESDL